MVKDLRKDPLFEGKKSPPTFEIDLGNDILLRYRNLVDQTIASRTWVMLCIGVAVFMVFTFLDWAVYPELLPLFFKIRLFASLFCLFFLPLNFFKKTKKYSIWIVDIVIVVLIGGICLMVYFSDGASSHYDTGINLTLLGMAIVNGFYVWHNIGTCFIVMMMYTIAVLGNRNGWDEALFFVACCFMGATSLFIIIMSKFYRIVHFKSFVQNEELRESQRKLSVLYSMAEEKAKIDDLTKIYNRRYFFEILANKIKMAKTSGSFFYLIIFDIDNFKPINDTYGHIFGDQVIATVAKVVRNMMRQNSYLGRFGGDEFMLIIDRATKEEFFSRLQMVSKAIQALELYCDGKKVELSASFGAARFDPDKGMDENKLIEMADDALLEVKRTKRGEIKLAE